MPMMFSDVSRRGSEQSKISRRKFLGRTVGLTVAALLADQVVCDKDDLIITKSDVRLARWPHEASGVTVGVLSDFHADYDHAVHRVARAALLLANRKPDIAIVAGDYISSHLTRHFLAPTVNALSPLTTAPGGAYAIMGNHDCWGNNHDLATKLLDRAGFTVLNNRSVPFPGVPEAYIVGLDDAWCHRMNVQKALRDVPVDAVKIVALHEPDFADVIGSGFDLQISGHSHGGQIRIPGLPVLHAPAYGRKYPEGLQKAEHHLVYTTRGIGMIGPQIRTFCPPEVTLLTLKSGAVA